MEPPVITLPVPSLVVLVGASGSGKSTFARRQFLGTEVVSSDQCRALVSDDESDQGATDGAFVVLHAIVGERLKRGRVTVVDATNVTSRARAPLLALARRHDLPAVALVFDLPEGVCVERAAARTERPVAPDVVRRQREQLEQSLPELVREGFQRVVALRTPDEAAGAALRRVPLPPNHRRDEGPFDVIGDVHGCAAELAALLAALGYVQSAAAGTGEAGGAWLHPAGRRALFLGDLVDRGPRVRDTLAIVMGMVAAGSALAVPGNHDVKLAKALRGRAVRVAGGLEQSLAELAEAPESMRDAVADFVNALPSHLVLDHGRLVAAHAGMRADLQGRDSKRVLSFALYGETTGEVDAHGLPMRLDWARSYRGRATVVYGHTPVPRPEWRNRTINIDTGCVFGGRLTALRYPELTLVQVPAARQYAVPSRPFAPAADAAAAPAAPGA
jgi:protein phosphatase